MVPTVYTDRHRLHATDDAWLDGVRLPSQEVPARAEALRASIESAALGPIIAPCDYGLGPLLAVHTADYVAYLQTAYARYAEAMVTPRPLLPRRTEVDVRRAVSRPAAFPDLADYYTYDYEDPILPGTWEAAYWSAQVALTAAELVRCAGAGIGTNLNLPLPLHCDDARYLRALDEALSAITAFAPAHLVLSLGLDAVGGDTIGKFDLTMTGWAEVARRVGQLGVPCVVVQEGGYRIEHIGQAAVQFLSALATGLDRRHPDGTFEACAASLVCNGPDPIGRSGPID